MLFATIMVNSLAAYIIFFPIVRYFKKRRVLIERGIRVAATVTRFWAVNMIIDCTMEYMVGEERKTVNFITFDWCRHKVGEMVDIAYLPEDPKQVMFAVDLDNPSRVIIHIIFCIFIFVAVAINIPSMIEQINSNTFVELCARGTPEQIEAKIKAGTDVNAKNDSGKTPLMSAIQRNNAEVIDMLIKAGADVNAGEKFGETPLMSAASFSGNPEVLRVLIQAGADVNVKNIFGTTPLILAAQRKSAETAEVLKTLIQAGAEVNAKNDKGETALNLAVSGSIPEIVSILLASGAAVSENDLELAQKNERLKNSAVIEELKSRLK